MDKRINNGGHSTKGRAGRPTKADEQKANTIFLTALKELYRKDKDDEAKVEFVKTLADSQRGQIFIAEHIFGKPKEKIEQVNINHEVTEEEAKAINKILESRY